MFERKSHLFFFMISAGILLMFTMFIHAFERRKADSVAIAEKKRFVRKFEITDLCIFTDARYTRHPSMADLNTPFQDYPMSLEHFPSGSILSLPPHFHVKTEQ